MGKRELVAQLGLGLSAVEIDRVLEAEQRWREIKTDPRSRGTSVEAERLTREASGYFRTLSEAGVTTVGLSATTDFHLGLRALPDGERPLRSNVEAREAATWHDVQRNAAGIGDPALARDEE